MTKGHSFGSFSERYKGRTAFFKRTDPASSGSILLTKTEKFRPASEHLFDEKRYYNSENKSRTRSGTSKGTVDRDKNGIGVSVFMNKEENKAGLTGLPSSASVQ